MDEQTESPVPAAQVSLLVGVDGEKAVQATLSDSAGWFQMEAASGGRFRLKAERLGYRSVTSPPFDLLVPDTLQVELRMAVDAILLAPLTVVSARPPLVSTIRLQEGGFMDRQARYGRGGLGLGQFLVKADWEQRSPLTIAQLLQDTPGVRVSGNRVFLRSVTGFDPRGCVPTVYIDGTLVRMQNGAIDEILPTSFITAVEVYPGLSRPARFMDMGESPCGAIVFWTG